MDRVAAELSDQNTADAAVSQACGVGSRMMTEIVSIAAARPGCSRVEWTADRDNATARSFYRALGYREFEGKVMYRVASEPE
jgi:ribosomal protein S18 acetylase RimI-like enzyme